MQTSIIPLDQTKQYKDMRFDAEFYSQEFLSAIRKITLRNFDFIGKISSIKSGTTPRERSEHLKEGIVLLKTTNIRDDVLYYTDPDDFFFIDNETDNRMQSTKLENNDVLLNIVGATTDVIGRTALIFDDFPKANITQAMAFCRIRDERYFPEYVFVFLSCYYGKTQTKYIARPTGQYNLNLEEVGFIRIPLFSKVFQLVVSNLVCLSKEHQAKAFDIYSEASNILLSEINLLNWKPKRHLSFVKNYSNTQLTSRIDAEYFQPMYDEIEKLIGKYVKSFDRVGNQFKRSTKSFERIPDKDYRYVEISCVNILDGSITPMVLRGDELPVNAKIKFLMDDIVVSKVRPYRGAIGIVANNDYVGSGAFTVLQENGVVNKETLFVFLRSKPMLAYSLKFNTGTSYPTITDDDILNFPLPLIDNGKQEIIKFKVIEAINDKHIAKQLLDIAKSGVEMAIEKNEKDALKWVDSEINRLGLKVD